jgi:hypothetical protein
VFHGRVHLFHYDLHGSEAADRQGVVGVLLTPSWHPERLWDTDTTMFAWTVRKATSRQIWRRSSRCLRSTPSEPSDGVERPGSGSALGARRIGGGRRSAGSEAPSVCRKLAVERSAR